jgi:hypothetical protein
MSVKREVRQLERAREEELQRLCGRIESLADTVENGPGRWVGEHPYMAVAGAAVSGFLTAQIAGGFARTAGTKRRGKRTGARGSEGEARERAEEDHRGSGGGWIEILKLVAEQLLQMPPESGGGSVRVGDAGAVRGGRFPREFEKMEEAAVG